ncbi:MAG: HAD-IA family hydrolase [Hyphomonadaceae bacterium]
MTLKLVIWDMDGTLVDSREVIQTAMVRAFEHHDLAPPNYEQTRKTVGLGLTEACAQLIPEGFEIARLPALVETYKQVFVQRRTEVDFVEPLYDGAFAALQARRDDGWLQAIATGRARRGIDAICEMHPGLSDFFDTTWSADDGPGKPSPFMVEEAMKAVGAECEESVMVGDATFDILMGRAANVHTLGVSWGFGRSDELEAAGAHSIHHGFDSLNAELASFCPERQGA